MKFKNNNSIAVAALCACVMLSAGMVAQAAPETGQGAASAPANPETIPMVPPAKPGVFLLTKQSANRYRLTVKGHAFTSRDAVEKYLLYRAADLALQQHFQWFTLVESRSKGDTALAPTPDPTGLHYSFRMKYWRAVWRYKLAGLPAWSRWSPFSNAAFFADSRDAKAITDFEVSANIAMHKGPMDDNNPLAFEPSAVSDFLVNQVLPPE
jgi:hypothetical protein